MTSAAGALALLLAVQVQPLAQDATGVSPREIAGRSDGWQAIGAPALRPGEDLSADSLKSSEEDIAASSAPLSGMGDETAPITPIPSLGGLGDEHSGPAVPGFGITTGGGETSQQVPGTNLDSSRHRALAPAMHDLDPYVPIGMRLGSFLLFTEAEIGTILTDNVLATDTDTHSDAAFEFAPDIRLESNWSRHFFSAQFAADRSWYRDFSVEDDRIYQARPQRTARCNAADASRSRSGEVADPGGTRLTKPRLPEPREIAFFHTQSTTKPLPRLCREERLEFMSKGAGAIVSLSVNHTNLQSRWKR
jgi:hypothetical protein